MGRVRVREGPPVLHKNGTRGSDRNRILQRSAYHPRRRTLCVSAAAFAFSAIDFGADKRYRPNAGACLRYNLRCIQMSSKRITAIPVALVALAAPLTGADRTIKFNRDVRPLLSDKCYGCHGPDAEAK